MSEFINWTKDTDGKYKKTERGHSAEITISTTVGATYGTASLVIDGGSPTVYDTRRQAKNAFEKYLRDK